MSTEKTVGLRTRPRAGGVAYYWMAASVSRKAKGFPDQIVRLHGSLDEIRMECAILTAKLHEWILNNQLGEAPKEPTIKDLIKSYERTEESNYHSVKHNTRANYDASLKILETEVGSSKLAELSGLDFKRWFKKFNAPAQEGGPERPRRAYGAIQLLRIVVGFGVVTNTPECVRLSEILRHMEFKVPKPRVTSMTFAQAEAICLTAIKDGLLSIALAQALQFELTLRQSDVIGQWEPSADAEDGGIVDRGKRWRDGLLWSHIGADGVLTKTTSKTGKIAVHDTTRYPFLRKIMAMVPAEKRFGPMIVSEATGLPYRYRHFFDVWRAVADKAGVPKGVWSRDSRAGGVTEGSDAGADLEHLRHHANHENIQTTKRYNRTTLEKTRSVADLRVAARNKTNGLV